MNDASENTQIKSDMVASDNIRWHYGELDADQRAQYLGQYGGVVWLTGLSGSGKSTVARRVERLLVEQGAFATVLDGDNLRYGLCSDLGFAAADRTENVRRAGESAILLARSNLITLCAFISPYAKDREAIRSKLGDRYLEIYCAADVAACAARDPKGLYAKAQAGEITNFTGISAPYEEPENPDLRLETGTESIDASAQQVVRLLQERTWLPSKAQSS